MPTCITSRVGCSTSRMPTRDFDVKPLQHNDLLRPLQCLGGVLSGPPGRRTSLSSWPTSALTRPAVQETGRLMPGFCADATRPPRPYSVTVGGSAVRATDRPQRPRSRDGAGGRTLSRRGCIASRTRRVQRVRSGYARLIANGRPSIMGETTRRGIPDDWGVPIVAGRFTPG
jgi:hypothetical protein